MTPKTASLIPVIVLALALIGTAVAGDQTNDLWPESGIFSGPEPMSYYLELRNILLGEHNNRLCQLFVLPSFDPEWTVYVVRDDETKGEAQVIFKSMKSNLWHKMLGQIMENTPGNVFSFGEESQKPALAQLNKPIDRATVTISESTVTLLEQVWSEMLSRVHYTKLEEDKDEMTIILDGTGYHISHYYQKWAGTRSGSTYSPEKGSNPYALVQLGYELRRYAIANEKDLPQIENTIIDKANALLEKLKKE